MRQHEMAAADLDAAIDPELHPRGEERVAVRASLQWAWTPRARLPPPPVIERPVSWLSGERPHDLVDRVVKVPARRRRARRTSGRRARSSRWRASSPPVPRKRSSGSARGGRMEPCAPTNCGRKIAARKRMPRKRNERHGRTDRGRRGAWGVASGGSRGRRSAGEAGAEAARPVSCGPRGRAIRGEHQYVESAVARLSRRERADVAESASPPGPPQRAVVSRDARGGKAAAGVGSPAARVFEAGVGVDAAAVTRRRKIAGGPRRSRAAHAPAPAPRPPPSAQGSTTIPREPSFA